MIEGENVITRSVLHERSTVHRLNEQPCFRFIDNKIYLSHINRSGGDKLIFAPSITGTSGLSTCHLLISSKQVPFLTLNKCTQIGSYATADFSTEASAVSAHSKLSTLPQTVSDRSLFGYPTLRSLAEIAVCWTQ